ncbi:hypothetical protein J6590_098111 [Homalodisca vitripennis]|nr:hypothetical protein J6590_098111 [Homalodisca vitripennis]
MVKSCYMTKRRAVSELRVLSVTNTEVPTNVLTRAVASSADRCKSLQLSLHSKNLEALTFRNSRSLGVSHFYESLTPGSS